MIERKSLGHIAYTVRSEAEGWPDEWNITSEETRGIWERVAEAVKSAVLAEHGTPAPSREYRTRMAMDEPIAKALAGVPGMTIREITGITVAIEHAVLAALAAWEG